MSNRGHPTGQTVADRPKTRLQVIVSDDLVTKIDAIADEIGVSRNVACAFGLYSWIRSMNESKSTCDEVSEDFNELLHSEYSEYVSATKFKSFDDYRPIFKPFLYEYVIPKINDYVNGIGKGVFDEEDADEATYEAWLMAEIKASDWKSTLSGVYNCPDMLAAALASNYIADYSKYHKRGEVLDG